MSTSLTTGLEAFSTSLENLVSQAAAGVIAVKAAPYRVVSGVSLADNLVAVTNHTLRREDRISVQSSGGIEGTGTIIGRDRAADLAILKIEGFTLAPLPAADPATTHAGALAVVVGMTMDVGPSASLGMVGAVGSARRIWRGATLDQFLRLDVNLYPSQSGAAVVNAQGQLIGLATPALSRHSTLAIPPVTLNRIAAELLREGRIRHGYLGIGMQPVALQESVSSKLDLPSAAGLILLSVEPESPAEKAGLQIGDILIELDSKPISQIDELQAALRGDAIGKTLEAFILRGGQSVKLPITVAERVKRER